MANGALLLVSFIALVTVIRAGTITHATILYNTLLTPYDTRLRPVTDQEHNISLYSEFIPTNIIEFETTEQRFTVLGYLLLSWSDEVLVWDPWLYGGIELMKVPINQLWTPSLILAKAFEGSGVIGDSASDIATVTYDGLVEWSPEGTFSFVCEVDIKYYPFDEQTCTLTYYISDETVHSVVLNHDNVVNLNQFIQNSEWDLVEVSKTIDFKYEANFININFRVQRRASFTTYTVITPLLMLAFLNVCVFLVPIDSGEKGSFAVTIFLSYGIFVTIITDTLPHNSLQISYFVLFLIVLLLLSVLSVFYTIMQAKVVASHGDKTFNFRLCCKKKPKQAENGRKGSDNGIFVVQPIEEKMGIDDFENEDIDEDTKKNAEEDDEDTHTWRAFLERLDTCLFVAFFTLVTVATTIFFALMMQRFGMNKLTEIQV